MERREFLKRGLVGLYGLRILGSLPGAPAPAPVASAATPVAPLAVAEPLIASGGLCAPLAPYYSLPNFTLADHPVRDALPSFTAPRGPVKFGRGRTG